ncbi:MAG TPA: hypothetical protein VMJ10_05510 [Kofleriaceae bacterium]|nr:hypothetical protein [Kofleriaceae bacterium]
MRHFVAAGFAVVVGACQNNGASNLPVNPGGGGGGGIGMHDDGGVDASDAGGTQLRVCMLTDPRGLNDCAMTGVAGLMVTLGSGSAAPTATTADDGSFTMQLSSGSFTWSVVDPTGTLIVPTIMPASGGSIIPVITQLAYSSLQTANSVSPDPSSADVFLRVDAGAVPLQGVSVVSSLPPSPYVAFYDGSSNAKWTDGTTTGAATGAKGTMWLPDLPTTSGSATITFVTSGDAPQQMVTVPIQPGTITMCFTDAS